MLEGATQADCIQTAFEAQVRRSPQAIALVYEDEQLSYAELNQHANQLAHYLRRLGVGPEVCVGLYMERSSDSMIALLAILKAGGAFPCILWSCVELAQVIKTDLRLLHGG